MKSVLLITYHFPPDTAVGGFRCQKFAKYLPECGWTPYVLTVLEHYHPRRDPGRLRDVGGTLIYRTRVLPSPLTALLGIRNILLRAVGRSDVLESRLEANARMTFDERNRVKESLVDRLRRFVRSLGRLPDNQIGWVPPGVIAGVRLIRRHGIEGVLTSGPPHSAHLIGFWLKRLSGVRWIADLRDPWVGSPQAPLGSRSALSDWLEARMERAVVRAADHIVLLTERSRESFTRRYVDQPPGKFVTITNGFDPEDFSTLPVISPEPIFTIVHAGTLYYRRSPRALLAAVASLVERGRIPADDIQVVFAGEIADGHDVVSLSASDPLIKVVRTTGPLSHMEALTWMRRADLLCLFAQGQPEQIPAKAFEYLAAGPPILAITGEGATTDLITKAGGEAVPDEPWAIEEAVHQHYLHYRAGFRPATLASPWTREEIRDLDRRRLTARLAGRLEEDLVPPREAGS
jgi:glycosyltransferase involved in cell wall biosynthesis